jgi:exodeoxyribonuclease-3
MKLFSWNVNGLRAVDKKKALDAFFVTYAPDIVCFQEIKIDEQQILAENFEQKYSNYHQFYSFAQKRGYSGTAIWSKRVPVQTVANFPDEIAKKYQLTDDFGDATKEGRLLTLDFGDFYLVGVYSPHTKRELERLDLKRRWDRALLSYIQQLEKTKPVVVCGDFNIAHQPIDLANPEQNQTNAGFTIEERTDFDNFTKAGLIDTFRHLHPSRTGAYTWWTWRANARARNIGWRIDYFLVSSSLKNQFISAEIYPAMLGSDHCPISLELKLN